MTCYVGWDLGAVRCAEMLMFPLEGLVRTWAGCNQLSKIRLGEQTDGPMRRDSILIHASTMGRTWFKKWLFDFGALGVGIVTNGVTRVDLGYRLQPINVDGSCL